MRKELKMIDQGLIKTIEEHMSARCRIFTKEMDLFGSLIDYLRNSKKEELKEKENESN